jgi:hypothetical protein
LNDSDILPLPDTCVVVPDAAVGAAVRAFIWRDSGAEGLVHLNRFPAAPFCTITWCLAGRLFLGASVDGPMLDRVIVGGPGSRPMLTAATGRLHAFTVVFFPDAFARLTGLSPGTLIDRLVPAHEVLPAYWYGLLRDIAGAADHPERVRRLTRFVADRCDAAPCGVEGTKGTASLSWLHGLRRRIDASLLCERQVERRIKRETGQTLRSLQCSGRFEAAVLKARDAKRNGVLSWAGLAGETGYADQSHICREFRKMSGITPARLIDPDNGDESFWIYRYWK